MKISRILKTVLMIDFLTGLLIAIKETFKHDTREILAESLEHEKLAIKNYYDLLGLIGDSSVYLEEYARSMIGQEELHALEVEKMLKQD